MIWIFLALTVFAVMAILVPLSRRPRPVAGGEAAVYRDQLEEIERDRIRGVIGEAEAEAARVEVARRLIAAAEAPQPPAHESRFRRRLVALLALLLFPLAAIAVYGFVGNPGIPDLPLAARKQPGGSLDDLVAKVESELARRPDDGQGWDVIAPVYLRMGQGQKAAEAFRNAIRLLGPSAARESGLGEALVVVADGNVTPEAQAAFTRALRLDAGQVRARFYLARAAEQAGQAEEASAAYRKLIAEAPEDAPYLSQVREALAQLALGKEGQGPAVDSSALENVSPEDRIATIRSMVEGLAVRLKDEPRDLGGQLRLIRAWSMLGERERAKEAGDAARAAFDGDQGARRRISDLLLALGIEDVPA